MTRHPFNGKTPVVEPVEIRLEAFDGAVPYVLVASRNPERGTIGASMSQNGVGVAISLANLQMSLPFPGKAVHGWQIEVVEAVASGLYKILEVR